MFLQLPGTEIVMRHWYPKLPVTTNRAQPTFAVSCSFDKAMDELPTVEIYVRLLDEGTDCSRPTQGVSVGHGLFRLLPTENYDPADEHWEFLPGSIVRAKEIRNTEGVHLLAVAPEDS